ncbi:glycoside hydrolase family 3 N-terminal domain-containing protein, partial [Streptomyces avermitilis]|uniref:glycoside hydrolase family 3 N-terminal domain-containing protein n=1 Tax=Streptomyces avermitilis TaxID=33903 RepID=UPI00371D6558
MFRGGIRKSFVTEGTVVSDYWSLPFLVNAHRVAADLPDAGALALRAGMDVELPEQRGFGDALVHAVEQGLVDADLVDRAVRRVLRQKAELGLLDPDWDPRPPALRAGELDLDKPESRRLAHAVAQSSAVLLSNDGILPLPAVGRIVLIGPCADDVRTMFGWYSFPKPATSAAGSTEAVKNQGAALQGQARCQGMAVPEEICSQLQC